MNNSWISVALIFTLSVLLGTFAYLGYAIGTSAGIIVMTVCLVTLVAFWVYVWMTSIYLIPADQMLVSFFLGTYEGTYVSGTYINSAIRRGQLNHGGMPGLGGLGLAVLLYPFFEGVRFPTTVIIVEFHADRVMTEDTPLFPSVPVFITGFLHFRLTPYLDGFVEAVDVLGKGSNLADKCQIRDNMWDSKNPAEHVYDGSRLAQILASTFEAPFLKAVREVGRRYPWGGPRSIWAHRRELENAVQDNLASEAGSIFVQAELLRYQGARGNRLGRAARSFDSIFRDIDVEDSDLKNELNAPMKAKLEAAAAKSRGEGEGDRLKAIEEKTHIPAARVQQAEVMKEIKGNINVIAVDKSLGDQIETLLGRFTGPGTPPNPGGNP